MLTRTCPECDGNGIIYCDCCGVESDCQECRGAGEIPIENMSPTETKEIIPQVKIQICPSGKIIISACPKKADQRAIRLGHTVTAK